ncbi:MAG: 16S rRNA (uracil(1498)-N(3))-methyltransferase [Turicibacter sp.]|nr:16S rRNA (uracil(1498)-N(3))-methyltransferase [Turicibacter sp.]
MQRYFLSQTQIQENQAKITGDDAHHISRVMRMQVGDQIIVCNNEKVCYLSTLKQIDGQEVQVTLDSIIEGQTELPIEVTIAHGLPKGDKFEWVIQKATECGVNELIPLNMERSVVKLDAKKASKKVERWNKIAKEAAEQSHRQMIPCVRDVYSLKQLLDQSSNYDVCLFAYEEIAKQGQLSQLKQSLNEIQKKSKVLVIIGPEGGISEKEEALLHQSGFKPCALGPRILRTETAPIYILSAISYALEL